MASASPIPLRMGVLGAARIARLFVEAVKPSPKIVVTAVASREAERAAAFARDMGIARVHPSYDALLVDPEIDAVYVPLPNNLHSHWSIRATDAGKHGSHPLDFKHRREPKWRYLERQPSPCGGTWRPR